MAVVRFAKRIGPVRDGLLDANGVGGHSIGALPGVGALSGHVRACCACWMCCSGWGCAPSRNQVQAGSPGDALLASVVMPSPKNSTILHAELLSNIREIQARGAITIYDASAHVRSSLW